MIFTFVDLGHYIPYIRSTEIFGTIFIQFFYDLIFPSVTCQKFTVFSIFNISEL